MQLVFEETLPERLLHLALAGRRLLPSRKPHQTHDLVDVGHHALHHHWRPLVAHLLKQFGQRSLRAIFDGFRRRFLFRYH